MYRLSYHYQTRLLKRGVMFLNYYGLTEHPFGVTPDPRCLYLGGEHREALASLVYGTETNRGFLALIAKPGMGKTSLLYHYLSSLRGKARTVFVFRTDCSSLEFLRHVLLDLGIDVTGMDLVAMHDSLNRLLIEEMRAGRRFVLVIDEAQNLDDKVLESIRLLSNFETPGMKLMQIILAGQPQLADRLASPSMAQLRQRISIIIRIKPFNHQEVNQYIDHKLWVAGCDKPSLFTVGARKLIAEHSEGIPRNINNLCFNALSLGCALKRKTIDRDAVLEVIADLALEPAMDDQIIAKPSQEYKALLPISALAKTNRPVLGGWLPRLAIAGILLLALGGFVVGANLREVSSMSLATPVTVAASSRSASSDSTVPAEPANEEVKPGTEVITVMPGQTLFRISVSRLGKYNARILEHLRELNPWLNDPDQIRSGQTITIPTATRVFVDAQNAVDQSARAVSAEVGNR